MTKPRNWILSTAALLAALTAAGVLAQDFWDDESLFAAEELTVDEAVTGSLPDGGATNDDDLFDTLFGGDGVDDVFVPDEDLADLSPAADEVEERDDAFEKVDSDVAFPDDLFEDTVSRGNTTDVDDTFDDLADGTDWTADTLLDDMMESGDQDAAVTDTLETAGLGDIFDGELDDGGLASDNDTASDDLDDLFGDLVVEEQTTPEPVPPPAATDTPAASDDLDDLFGDMFGDDDLAADPPSTPADDPMDIPEKGLDTTDDDFDDLFGGLATEAPATPEPVAPVAADDDVDFDALFEELAEPAAPAPVDTPQTEAPTAVVETAPTASPAYRDELALDDDLFSTLAEEGRRAAQAPPSVVEPTAAPAPAAPVLAEPASAVAGPSVNQPVVQRPESVPAPDVVQDTRPPAPEGTAVFEEAERLRRVARENHAISSLERAKRALIERDYRRSVQLYEEALRTLPRREDLEPARARARTGLADAYFRQAAALVRMGDLEGALQSAQGAVRHGHRRGPEAVRRIQAQLDAPAVQPPPVRTERWEQDDFKRIDREIQEWLRRGREAYLTGEYERSILAFESVLIRDPENKEAIRMMRAAAGRQFDRSSMELDATRQRMMAAVRDTWNPRQYGLHEEPIDDEAGLMTEVRQDAIQREVILEKMTAIRLPEVNFRQANVRDVLTFLQQQSVEFDPAPVRADRTGVNIILQLEQGRRDGDAGAPRGRAPAGQTDFFGMQDDAGAAGGSVDEVLVTFTALDISLKEALDIVVDVANLKYLIRGNVVMVLPSDAAIGEIEHRMYDVLPSAIQRLQDLSSAVAPGGGGARRGGGDFLALDGDRNLGGGEGDLRAFFEEMGVEWPARSSIKFVRGLSKLVVANTQENLAVFEKVLSILNVVPYQIEIEARFIEVAQTDVDSLGLEWMLTDTWQIAEMAADAGRPANARRRLVMDNNETTGGFTAGNRFLTQGGSRGPLGAQIMDQVASVSSVLTNPELSMVLHALQQRGHTDLLSAPKITTQSGQQATIKVVTEYIYPTSFAVSGIEGGGGGDGLAGGGNVGAVVEPMDFQTREVGVILEVLPEVSPEGQMIDLILSPEVVSEPTWRNYGSTYTSFDPNGNPVEQVLNMEQPFFHTRKLRTRILIYNGATVVMGGMITEVRNSVDDRVPLLGDIPVLGRLFRSKYDSSEKRNLLIFVTARLVDPAGRPLDRERLGVDPSIAERIVSAED